MGTDISLYIERKTESGWKVIGPETPVWQYDQYPQIPRNYDLFCELAGIRCGSRHDPDYEGMFGRRGMPEDISDEVYEAAYGWPRTLVEQYPDKYQPELIDYAHNWLTYAELCQIQEHIRSPGIERILEVMDDNCRVVFWFD